MIQLLFLILIAGRSHAQASAFYSVTLLANGRETVWLANKPINQKTIYVFGYRSPRGHQLEQVVPEKDFSKALLELENLKKDLMKHPGWPANPFCRELTWFKNNKQTVEICLDQIHSKDKSSLLRWIKNFSNLVVGV